MRKVLGWLLVFVFLLSGCLPAAPAIGADLLSAGKRSAPVEVQITSEILSATDARLTAQVKVNTNLEAFSLRWVLPEGVALLDGALENNEIPARDATRAYVLTVRKTGPQVGRVRVGIRFQDSETPGTAGDDVYLGADPQGALRIVPLEEALAIPGLTTISAGPETDPAGIPALPPGASSGMIDARPADLEDDSPAQPQAGEVTISITGRLFYPDFQVTSSGLDANYVSKPIRGATVKIKKGLLFTKTAATTTTISAGPEAGRFTTSFKAKIGDNIRIEVLTKGKNVTVDNFWGQPWAIAAFESQPVDSPTIDLQDHTLWDSSWSNDKKEETGVFNIFDVATSGMDVLKISTAVNRNLHFKWFINNPFGTAYTTGTDSINVQGKSDDSDHWDDNITLHEMGHWVMARYAKSVPNASGDHSDCVYSRSRPGLAYSEGWASFFSFAVRETLGEASYNIYLDTEGWPTAGKTGLKIYRNHEVAHLSGDTYIDHDTGLGNWCEYQVAAALLDVLDDSPNEETIDGTFDQVFDAFRTRVNKHYPYNINEWWYGWTNSTRGRGASAASFGSEQQIIDNFRDSHAIKLGVLFDVTSTDANKAAKMNPHLWTPYPYEHIGKLDAGNPAGLPYATYNGGDNDIWVSSAYPGTYRFGVTGLVDMAASEGVVTLWDASKVSDWYLDNGVAPGRKCEAAGLWTYLPGNRNKVWWYALDYTPSSNKLSCRNKVQNTIIHTPYESSGIVSGTITDATNQALAGSVHVCVKGRNICTDSVNGQYTLPGVPSGLVKIIASSEDYLSLTQEVLVAPEETTLLNFVLSPTLEAGEWRIVLTWEAAPADIDAHLWVPVTSTTKSHIYYSARGNCTATPYACLDVDDRNGYGPETITITTRFNRGYSYKVYNWSGETTLAGSGARVRVYNSRGLVKDLLVPNNGNSGRWWHVFDISASGSVVVKNTLSDVSGMSGEEIYPEKEALP